MEGFTRQEAIALTGVTSSRLAYLDRVKLVIPQKYGNSKKPVVIYSWEQILEIRAISNLRQKISLQTIRKIISFLELNGFDDQLKDKHLVTVNDEVYWVRSDWSDMPEVMKVASGKNNESGQFILVAIPPFIDISKSVWETAKKSKVIDFNSFKQRVKSLSLEPQIK
jgi:DNA-binding transcriptional MerR regulator